VISLSRGSIDPALKSYGMTASHFWPLETPAHVARFAPVLEQYNVLLPPLIHAEPSYGSTSIDVPPWVLLTRSMPSESYFRVQLSTPMSISLSKSATVSGRLSPIRE